MEAFCLTLMLALLCKQFVIKSERKTLMEKQKTERTAGVEVTTVIGQLQFIVIGH